MKSFWSPEQFVDVIGNATYLLMVGGNVEETFQGILESDCGATPQQARVAAKVIATLVAERMKVGSLFDPLEPTKAVEGSWRRSGTLGGSTISAKTTRNAVADQDVFELREEFFYSHASKSGRTSGGIYVAGLDQDGYIVALCSIDEGAEEMRVARGCRTALVGSTPFSRFTKLPTVHTTLLGAAMEQDLADISMHLHNGENPNQLYKMESPIDGKDCYVGILHMVVYHGRVAAAEALLTAGADPNLKDSSGQIPIGSALAGGRTDSAECLLRHGADVNARLDRRGNTVLHSALASGQQAIARVLLRHGADRHAKNNDGISCVQMAMFTGMTI